jgi:hypothetical protein
MRTPLQALYNFFHPGPSAEEVDCLHKDLRLKVHENRNVAQRALGSMRRSNKAANEQIKTAEGAIQLLEGARHVGVNPNEAGK